MQPFAASLRLAIAITLTLRCAAEDIHIEPSDSRLLSAPSRDLRQAVALARPGDTIWLKTGIYALTTTLPCAQSGTPSSPIRITAKAGERPVLDFSGLASPGVSISGAWWEISNVSITGSARFGLQISGIDAHNNVIRNVGVSRNRSSGLVITNRAANNLIDNCDSFLNCDTASRGEYGDGFGAHDGVGVGNRFLKCRAWNNSDDGFDCWEARNPVVFEKCLTWKNGINVWDIPNFQGDGNGFKLGRGSGAHVLNRCIAWDLPGSGFDLNGNASGVTIQHSAALRCGLHNFAIMNSHGNIENNTLLNNISIAGKLSIDPRVDDRHNSWGIQGLAVAEHDFKSLDARELQGSRRKNGDLRASRFLHPRACSATVNTGTMLNQPYVGRAPDLGPFEYKPLWCSILTLPRALIRKLRGDI